MWKDILIIILGTIIGFVLSAINSARAYNKGHMDGYNKGLEDIQMECEKLVEESKEV